MVTYELLCCLRVSNVISNKLDTNPSVFTLPKLREAATPAVTRKRPAFIVQRVGKAERELRWKRGGVEVSACPRVLCASQWGGVQSERRCGERRLARRSRA